MKFIKAPQIKDRSQLYDGAELRPYIGRAGAEHALELPSRAGRRLHYRDGRVTDIAGKTLTRSKA